MVSIFRQLIFIEWSRIQIQKGFSNCWITEEDVRRNRRLSYEKESTDEITEYIIPLSNVSLDVRMRRRRRLKMEDVQNEVTGEKIVLLLNSDGNEINDQASNVESLA